MTDEEKSVLRDDFAGRAMHGYINDSETVQSFGILSKKEGLTPERLIAKAAYEMADAMLVEREIVSEEKIKDIAKDIK